MSVGSPFSLFHAAIVVLDLLLSCMRNKFSVFVRNSDSAAAAVSGCVCLAIHVKVISEYPLNLPYASHRMMMACMHIHSHTTVLSDYDDGSLAIADANIVINNLQHNCRTVKYDW